jgi:hypothetical protein
VIVRAALLAVALLAAAPARADEAWLRVITADAAIRSGPAERFREVHRASRGEVLRIVERATLGYWLRVALPDGSEGWILGDETLPFTVDAGAAAATHGFDKVRAALFAPSPIHRSRAGFSFGGGLFGGDGLFMFRPSVIVEDHLALEAHVGEAIGKDAALLIYGLDADVLLWPDGPLVPFVSLGGGGATSFPKLNAVAATRATQASLDAGGGLMLILRYRITLRVDIHNYTLFTPDRATNRQEYSGGLAVYF